MKKSRGYKKYLRDDTAHIPLRTRRRRQQEEEERNPIETRSASPHLTKATNAEVNANISSDSCSSILSTENENETLWMNHSNFEDDGCMSDAESSDDNSQDNSHDDSQGDSRDFDGGNHGNWFDEPIYDNATITCGEYVHMILSFAIPGGLTKTSLAGLLKLIERILPAPNNVPATQYFFDKFLESNVPSFNEAVIKHRLCETCGYYLGEFSHQNEGSCTACGSEKTNGIFVEYNVRSLLIDAFENRKLYELLEEQHNASAEEEEDVISDITSGQQFKKIQSSAEAKLYDVFFSWNTDGTPSSHSSNGQLWPIQLEIINIPPKSRKGFQIVAGLYYSLEQKPKSNAFLKPFINTMQSLLSDGFDWQHPTKGKMHSIAIAPVASLDAPAKSMVIDIMGHSGLYSCSYCEHPGETASTGNGHNHVFSFKKSGIPLRTDASMLQQSIKAVEEQKQHVKGMKNVSSVVALPFCDLAASFPPEYLHNLLGVFKYFINWWTDTHNCSKPYYLPKPVRDELDARIKELRYPDTVPREPRPLKNKGFYKASEIQTLYLFVLPILLKGQLAEPYYQNFLLLVKISYILLQSKIRVEEIDLAEHYMKIFCWEFQRLYGLEKCTLIVHHLIHLPHFVRLWGPLWAWSAFPFENGNGMLKKFNHCPNKVNVEIANTLRYYNAMVILGNRLMSKTPATAEICGPLGAPAKNGELDPAVLLALNKETSIPINELKRHICTIYSRATANSNVFTSELYQREKKRCNSAIAWGEPKQFGVIKFFVTCNHLLYAITQELRPCTVPPKKTVQHDLNISFSEYFYSVKVSPRLHAVPVNRIVEKILRVDGFVCRPQAIVMRC